MLSQEVLKKIQTLHFKTKRMASDLFAGRYVSAFKGRGMEFAEVREYYPGDDIRTIDWNVSARYGHPFVKVFHEERELTVMLVLDVSGSHAFGTRSRLKRELLAETAGMLAFLAIRTNDKVGAILFSSKVEKYIPPKKGTSHVWRLIKEIFTYEPQGKGTDINEALTFLNTAAKRHSIVFLLSDCLDEGFEKPLRMAAKKHQLTVIRLTDPAETALPDAGLVSFCDPETGENIVINTSQKAVRQLWMEHVYRERRKLSETLNRAGVDLVDIYTDKDVVKPLMKLFEIKGEKAMTKRMLAAFAVIAVLLFIACGKKTEDVPKNTENKNAPGNYPKITASVDLDKVRVGDIINLTLSYSVPAGVTVSESDITGIEGLAIVGKKSIKNSIILSIIIDKPEPFEIKPVSLSFKDGKGVLNIVKTEAIKIEVQSNLGDKPAEAQLKPIMDIMPTYPFILRLLPWLIGIIILGAIGAGIYFFRKRKRRDMEALKEIKPPHVTAKEELERLISMNHITKGQYKEFYFRYSEILRQYIEKLRGFPAVELTTEEIARKIKDDSDRKLMPLLRDADLVKFADVIPTQAKNADDVSAAFDYIEATTPVATEAE